MNAPDRPPTRSQLKHVAILEAAAHEFRGAGFVATSMDRIADRAGVSKRTVYNHFESKEALFEAILEVLWTRSHEATEVAYDTNAPIRKQLEHLAHRELEILADENLLGLARALVAEAIRSPQILEGKWAELSKRGAGLPRWVRAAVADNKLQVEDPDFAAEQFIALVKAFAFWPQVVASQPPPTIKEREKIVESAVEMFLAAYGQG